MSFGGAPGRPYKDWGAIMEDLLHGHLDQQRVALLELQQLISNILTRHTGWGTAEEELRHDVRQTVLLKLVKSFREGRLRSQEAFVDYVHTMTRNTFVDSLRARRGYVAVEELPEPDPIAPAPSVDRETRMSIQTALRNLPERERAAVEAVYIQGLTYEEAAEATGIPLGSLKRYLRQGLGWLRKQLDDKLAAGDPLQPAKSSLS